jgi:ribonuclease HI
VAVSRPRKRAFAVTPADEAITAYTDGSSLPTPRRGGIGVRFVYCDRLGVETTWDLHELGRPGATNNQMELLAVITALREIQSRRFPADLLDAARRIDICTDSRYVVDNVNNAIFAWPKTGWTTRDGYPVENAELWKDLVRELSKVKKRKRTEVVWGKGHTRDNPHNAAADRLAKASAQRPAREPITHVTVRHKKTDKKLERGSVQMLGQRLTIRIITAEYLPTRRLHKLRYEVISRRSQFHGNVDIAYSDDPRLRAGHTYFVTMSSDREPPRIVKCHREMSPKQPNGT